MVVLLVVKASFAATPKKANRASISKHVHDCPLHTTKCLTSQREGVGIRCHCLADFTGQQDIATTGAFAKQTRAGSHETSPNKQLTPHVNVGKNPCLGEPKFRLQCLCGEPRHRHYVSSPKPVVFLGRSARRSRTSCRGRANFCRVRGVRGLNHHRPGWGGALVTPFLVKLAQSGFVYIFSRELKYGPESQYCLRSSAPTQISHEMTRCCKSAVGIGWDGSCRIAITVKANDAILIVWFLRKSF